MGYELKNIVVGYADAFRDKAALKEWLEIECDSDECEEIQNALFESILDINYKVSSNCDLLEIELTLALGGPNVFMRLDGKRVVFEGYWGNEEYRYQISDDIGLFDMFSTLYPCGGGM